MGASLPPVRTQVGANVAPFVGGINQATASLGGFKGGLAGAAAGLVAFAGIKGIQSAVNAFADFDEKMTESTAIMGELTDETLENLRKKAIEVSKTNIQSAEEAAESYFFLASAGLDAEQSMAALPAVADFAQAGMFDMATATDLATDAQSALGLTVDDSTQNLRNLRRVTDVLVKSNTLANASVQQFSEALTNKLGARLRILNKDIEEGTAALAALADQGIKGRRAGQGLNIVLRDLARQAVVNRDAFDELGIEIFDADGNMRNIADIMEDFEGQLQGATAEVQTQKVELLGLNRRAADYLLTLIGTSEKIREFEKANRDAGGTAEEVADKQLNTLNRQLGLLGDQFEAVKISAGGAIAPEIAKTIRATRIAVRELTGAVSDFNETTEGSVFLDIITPGVGPAGAISKRLFGNTPVGFIISGLGKIRDEVIAIDDRAREAEQQGQRFAEMLFGRGRGGDGEGAEGGGPSAEELERQKLAEERAQVANAIQTQRLRLLEEELGIQSLALAREREKLRLLVEEGAERDAILQQARRVAELEQEQTEAIRNRGMTIHGADRFRETPQEMAERQLAEGGLPSGELAGPGEKKEIPDDVIDGTDKLGSLLQEAAIPALDEFAGKLGIGSGMLASFLDSLLTSFGKEFGGKGGAMGFLGDVAGAFAGGFQSGGRIPAGRFGVVHPGETIMTGPASVKPAGSGGTQRNENNFQISIEATDAESFEKLLREKGGPAMAEMFLGMAGSSEGFSRGMLTGSGG